MSLSGDSLHLCNRCFVSAILVKFAAIIGIKIVIAIVIVVVLGIGVIGCDLILSSNLPFYNKHRIFTLTHIKILIYKTLNNLDRY